jgi:hypothetical protein
VGSDDLADTQRWMLAAIMGEGTRPGDADGVVAAPGGLGPEERVGIYRRGYQLRLVGCLREMYPGLEHALGGEIFEAFALDYLDAHPPSSYTLNALGARWPDHLEATRPEGEGWPDFLVDLARLERTFHEVYDCEGPREAPQDADPRMVRTRYPVAGYLAAVRRGEDPPLPAAKASHVAVARRDWVVTLTELECNEVAT